MACWRVANEWLLSGKNICRPITWQKHSYWYKSNDGIIMYGDGTTAEVHLNQINADDWEIWKEENKYSRDVKKSIRELRKRLKMRLGDNFTFRELVDPLIIEIFGTKLTEEEKW